MKSDAACDSFLRNFLIRNDAIDPNDAPCVPSLPEALRAFRKALGYDLKFARAGSRALQNVAGERPDALRVRVGEPGEKTYGALSLARVDDLEPKVAWNDARALVESLASVLAENYKWRDALQRAQASLAAQASKQAIDVDANDSADDRRDDERARNLRDALRSGALALGFFNAASLSVLDDRASSLKTVAVWRLPDDRLLAPPRPLRGARAELEALLGNAVVLNDEQLAELWKAPEAFPCAVCIPICRNDVALGVAWFFSDARREINARETEILDLVARRIADELVKDAPSK